MTESTQNAPRRPTGSRILGLLLMTVGGLIATLCGLCTVAFSVMFLSDGPGNAVTGITLPLMFGALPIAIGVILFFVGRRVYRGK